MKKQRNYAWLAVLIVMAMAAVPSVLPSILYGNKVENKIVNTKTDKQIAASGECLCIPGYRPPCPVSEPLCNEGLSGDRVCGCPAVANGKCVNHQPTVPKKPGTK